MAATIRKKFAAGFYPVGEELTGGRKDGSVELKVISEVVSEVVSEVGLGNLSEVELVTLSEVELEVELK